jgi:hypothetical protein
MRGLTVFFGFAFTVLAGALQADPAEPPRGSAARAAILDTIRVMAEYDLGAPVEFVVLDLAAEGDLAFARLMAQRPGDVPIDMSDIPMVTRRFVPPDLIDGPRIEAFLARTDGRWHVVEYGVGSTDVWWWAFDCDRYGAFLRDWGC